MSLLQCLVPSLPGDPVTRSLRPGSARAALAELVQLFPRGLFEDALPPIVLRSQVYSLVPDRTAADRQLVRDVGAASALPRGLGPPAVQQALVPVREMEERGPGGKMS